MLYNVKEEKKIYLGHEITCIEIYLQFTKNKRRKQEFICFKIILAKSLYIMIISHAKNLIYIL